MYSLMVLRLLTWVAVDPVPADNNVKAGWVAFALFIALGIAVALLGWSLAKHLRKVNRNAEAGVFGPSEPKPRPRGL